MKTNILFEPFPFGKQTLRNRIVMAPMTRSKAPDGLPNEAMLGYYRRRAEGEVGLIVTEGVIVEHPGASGYPDVPRMYGEDAIAEWARIVDAVHEAGGLIVPQLWHVGSVRKKGTEPHPEVGAFAPSAVPHPVLADASELPRSMSTEDIDDVVRAFAEAAANAKEAGFDGVEIHGAHGYLIDQFFWDKTNRRTDEYGGSLPQRTRFAEEIIRAVRAALGPELPIIFRFSQWKQGAYMAKLAKNPTELEAFLAPLASSGVDIFHASTRKYWKSEFPGSDLNLAGWTRKLTGKTTISVGSIGLDQDFLGAFVGKGAGIASIDNLLKRMSGDEFQLAAVGRALLADPEWPRKIREGRFDELIPFTPQSLESLEP